MQRELKYSSTIKDMPFLFLETRRTARFLCESKNEIEIVELSIKDNIFQLKKERRRKDLPKKILTRLSSLDINLIEIIANGRDEDTKLIVFLAIIKTDRLFYEFMRDVYSDKHISGHMEGAHNRINMKELKSAIDSIGFLLKIPMQLCFPVLQAMDL